MMTTIQDLASGLVKPEFGNPEHIAAIKKHEKELEEREKKKLWSVTLRVSGYQVIEVEAYDEDEAIEAAKDEINCNLDDYDIENIEAEVTGSV